MYSNDKYDDRHIAGGKNELFIGERAGWRLHIVAHFLSLHESKKNIYMPIDMEGQCPLLAERRHSNT